MKMPPPIATKFTKLVLTILAITILGIILSFISQDHTLLMLSAGVAVAGGVKIIDYCNASAPAYYDSIWFVTRTRHSRSNLLNRIFITRGRRTVYSSSAWLIKETVHPLPSHYNKNKHSLRGFLYASGAMLILYQTKNTITHLPSGDRTHSPQLVSQNYTPAVLPLRVK